MTTDENTLLADLRSKMSDVQLPQYNRIIFNKNKNWSIMFISKLTNKILTHLKVKANSPSAIEQVGKSMIWLSDALTQVYYFVDLLIDLDEAIHH